MPAPTVAVNRRTVRVVLVEDSADDAELVIAALRRAQIDPEVTRVDTEPAFRAAMAINPEVIISDLRLPAFDGHRALALRRELAPHVPFILVSGAVDDETASAVTTAGATDYLLKDRLGRLGAAVIKAIEERETINARNRAEGAAALLASRYENLVSHSTDVLAIIDLSGRLVHANQALATILGYSVETVVGDSIFKYVHPDDLEVAARAFADAAAHDGVAVAVTVRLSTSTGGWRWLEAIANNRLGDPSIGGMVVNARDVTERVEAAAVLALEAEISGRIAADAPVSELLDAIASLASGSDAERSARFEFHHPDFAYGSGIPPAGDSVNETPIVVEGEIVGMLVTSGRTSDRPVTAFDDLRPPRAAHLAALVAQREIAKSRLSQQALHDPLTGLANRALLTDRIANALARAGAPITLLILGIDHFKLVNDGLGHDIGDRVLCCLGTRLAAAIEPGCTLARVGGDEFAILVDRRATDLKTLRLGHRLLEIAQEPIEVDTHSFRLSVSVGMAERTRVASSSTQLMADADTALGAAKRNGRNRVEIYDVDSRGLLGERLALEQELRAGIPRGELVGFLQPIVNLCTGVVRSAEVLVRWQHPTRGLLMPLQFISWAEETDLIVDVGAAMIDIACAHLVALGPGAGISVSVNAAAREILDPTYADRVLSALTRHGLSPALLAIELTESTAITDAESVRANLAKLRRAGVRIYLDDFGTGYSSLSYLQRLAVDVLKIDRSFVTAMSTDARAWQVVVAIAALARALSLTTVAEGVETDADAAALAGLGIECAQGYLYAKPMPFEPFQRWLIDRGAVEQPPKKAGD
jgi:diguanylate cyclase (GGDEF)-like protein/PAS domain S-box-containing protein